MTFCLPIDKFSLIIYYLSYIMIFLRQSILHLVVFFVLVTATGADSAQQDVESLYQNARKHFYTLFSSPDQLENRKKWLKVIDKFKIIADNRPQSVRGADATYTLGLLYERLYYKLKNRSDKASAIAYFGKIEKRYPKSSLVDDAHKHLGDIAFKSRNDKAAEKIYRKTIKRVVKKQKPAPKKFMAGKKVPQKKRVVPARTKNLQQKRMARPALSRIEKVTYFSKPSYTRVILHLSSKTAYREEILRNPSRIFVDLLGTVKGRNVPKLIRFTQGTAGSLRIAQNRNDVARVVLDLGKGDIYHSIAALDSPARIIIDIGKRRSGHRKHARVATGTRVAKKKSGGKTTKRTAPVVISYRGGNEAIRTIVIDAGHGGKDPGAIGPNGTKEKNITLAIAKKLRPILQKRLGAKVYLTRSRDKFLELDERTVLANSLGADLFISIHVNASRSRKAHGIETYFLSPARSKDELATAARENMIRAGAHNEIDNDLAYIMSDLSNTAKVNDSSTLANRVQKNLVRGMRRSYKVKDKGVKQAMFYVLWRASMPSILIETGFITNPGEERRLRTGSYTAKLASAIADGVVKYSNSYTTALNR